MRFLLLSLLLAACASTGDTPAGTANGSLTGRVVAVDLSPMAYDGNGLITVAPDGGGASLVVHIPARQNLCAATLEDIGDVAPGDRVEVRGEPGEGTVTPCTSADHVFRVTERATPGRAVVRGVLESGFETSAFRPCDRPGEVWWLTPDATFAEQFEAIRQRERGDGGRGLRLFVEATVVGDLSDAGAYGHLGAYDRQLTVRETRDMVFLGRDLDDVPACR